MSDYNPLGSSVCGISQARTLKWVAIFFSRGSSWLTNWTHISCIGRWILYHWATKEAQFNNTPSYIGIRRFWEIKLLEESVYLSLMHMVEVLIFCFFSLDTKSLISNLPNCFFCLAQENLSATFSRIDKSSFPTKSSTKRLQKAKLFKLILSSSLLSNLI